MLGKRPAQRGLFEADHLYGPLVGQDSFYGFLASQRGKLFRDEDFAEMYCAHNGRDSVPPSLLATALLLQTYERVSDEEAKARADFDLRWKVALGLRIEEQPFAKSTLQLFRAQLILHEKMRDVFERSLSFARETGYMKRKKVKVALDTSFILGRGAVKDTYNLLADGIVQLMRVLARLGGENKYMWARQHNLGRYLGRSVKGESQVDWDDIQARQAFLASVVADADHLLETARQVVDKHAPESEEGKRVTEAAALLSQLLLQDVERSAGMPQVRDGVAKDRVVSVHDPEMRHGHKSKRTLFDGHKAAIAVETESQLITAAKVLPGNAYDGDAALELVQETETNAQVQVDESIGDCAYGDAATRQAFAEAGRILVARVPEYVNKGLFPKQDFVIDLQRCTCRCPGGQETGNLLSKGSYTDRTGRRQRRRVFQFDPADCAACPLRPRCVAAAPGKGRTISLHPQEALLQQARQLQHSPAYAAYRRLRQTAEHRLARLMQLGVRQARYFGRKKTLAQLLLAATVADLTLVATQMNLMRGQAGQGSPLSSFVSSARNLFQSVLALVLPTSTPSQWAFRPDS